MGKEKLRCSAKDCDDDTFFVDGNIAYVSYDGISVLQHNRVYDVFDKFISEYKPIRILEIGTAYGGLTLMLRDILDENHLQNSEVWTIDVIEMSSLNQQIEKGTKIKYTIKNYFSSNFDSLVDAEDIINFIKKEGKTLILCDGASKKNEFRLLSPHMKNGDVIMAHDYARDKSFFEKEVHNKIWYWHEIQDSDIEKSCSEQNLLDFYKEEFEKIVWVCKIKSEDITKSEEIVEKNLEDEELFNELLSIIKYILHKYKKI